MRVLYVEDNRINVLLFEEAMRMRKDIELRVAETGSEAMALVQDWTPQMLVLDANLPDITGTDLLTQLRRRTELQRTPAFMCSADAHADDLSRAQAAGFSGYWTKPLDLLRVNADIDAFLASLNLPISR